MTVYEAVISIFLFLHRLKRNIQNLSEREFEKMLYSNDLTYNQVHNVCKVPAVSAHNLKFTVYPA